ncbi:MAG: hypothetical protein BAJALOKI1v1_740005 [Promethearchaeota archaeon]|nr:MAG: hypothetical protein BAJALOKI1v1_740005 [Candidatus Lokiarchaeota archaeon]
MEESSKNRINPAPEEGIGALPARLLLLRDLRDIFFQFYISIF